MEESKYQWKSKFEADLKPKVGFKKMSLLQKLTKKHVDIVEYGHGENHRFIVGGENVAFVAFAEFVFDLLFET